MKNLILYLSLFCGLIVSGQKVESGKNYYFKSSPEYSIMSSNTKLNGTAVGLPKIKQGYKVHILDVTEDTIYFKYLNFEEDSLVALYNKDINNQVKVFSMEKDYFEKKTNILYDRFRGFKYGAYSVPIRLRNSKSNFEFDSNLSLGANIISRWGLRKYEHAFVDLSLGISLTKVNLNQDNSDLGLEGTDFQDIKTLSPAALTISFGALFNLAENINSGLYYGWDFISSSDQKANWVYNKKPWLGVGINIAFNGDEDKSGSQSGTPND